MRTPWSICTICKSSSKQPVNTSPTPPRGTHRAYVEELVRGELPVVEINRRHAGDLLDAAVADNFRGAYQMTEYLIGMGHRRIGLILGEMELITGKNRLEGYRRAHEDAGLTLNRAYLCTGSFNRQYGEQATRGPLALPEPPPATFAGNNRILMVFPSRCWGSRACGTPGRDVRRRVRELRLVGIRR